jgi:hypothetical protein
MATLPAFLRTMDVPVRTETVPRRAALRAERDPFLLRALPHEDVFFYSKRIDNSRLVREADPQARGACWSAIGAASVALVLLTSLLAPSVAGTLAGYKLESLRAQEQKLLTERRVLELQEAALLRLDRLEKLARAQNLVAPRSEQIVHLEPTGDAAVAMIR